MRCRRLPPIVAWLRTCGLAEFSSASEMTGNCSITRRVGGHLRHRGGGADPEALRSELDAIVEKAREADQPLGPAHVFL